MHQPDGLKIKI